MSYMKNILSKYNKNRPLSCDGVLIIFMSVSSMAPNFSRMKPICQGKSDNIIIVVASFSERAEQ